MHDNMKQTQNTFIHVHINKKLTEHKMDKQFLLTTISIPLPECRFNVVSGYTVSPWTSQRETLATGSRLLYNRCYLLKKDPCFTALHCNMRTKELRIQL